MFLSLIPLHAIGPHHLSYAKVAQWNWFSWKPLIFSGLLISHLSFQTCLPPQVLVAPGGAGKEGAKPQTRKGQKGGKTDLQYQVNWFTRNCKRDPTQKVQQTKTKMMKFHSLTCWPLQQFTTQLAKVYIAPKRSEYKICRDSHVPTFRAPSFLEAEQDNSTWIYTTVVEPNTLQE